MEIEGEILTALVERGTTGDSVAAGCAASNPIARITATCTSSWLRNGRGDEAVACGESVTRGSVCETGTRSSSAAGI